MHRLRWFALLLVLIVVAAACGDDDDDDDGGDTTETTAAETTETTAAETTEAAGGETTEAGDGDETTTTGGDEEGAAGVPDADGRVPGLQAAADEALGEMELFSDDELADGTTRGITDDTVLVGGVSSITAGGTPVFFGICEGAAARIERANTDGELSRQIEIADCVDDGTNPDTSEQEIQRLVLDEQVFALLPVSSQAFFSEEFLNEERVPYFGFGFQPAYCGYGNPFGFADTGAVSCEDLPAAGYDAVTTFTVEAYMDAAGIDDPSTVRLAAIYEDAPAGRNGANRIELQAEAAGVEVVYSEAVIPPPTAGPVVNYDPFVNAILDTDPTVVLVVTSGTSGLYEGLRNAGFEGDMVGYVFADPGILAAPELAGQLDGSIQIQQGLGTAVFESDEWDTVRADAEAVGFDPAFMGTGFLHGYASADLFVAGMAAAEQMEEELGVPMSAELYANAINSGFFYPGLGNVVCATEWPVSHVAGSPCGSGVRVDVAANELAPVTDLTYYRLEILPI